MIQPIDSLLSDVAQLTEAQRAWVRSFVQQFKLDHDFKRLKTSDLVTDTVSEEVGNLLRIHHAMSKRSLSKAPFEYAFEKALQLSGYPAKLALSSTNPGYDLTIGSTRVSLKTEAAKNVKEHQLHVSKWMEMGTGAWDPPNVQLPRFLNHLNGYDRILSLRCLKQTGSEYWYELVEIPKELMLESQYGTMEMAAKTRQDTSPWYCRVKDATGKPKYSLYFDAGSERKLQVKALLKEHCIVHATWRFSSVQLALDDAVEGNDQVTD